MSKPSNGNSAPSVVIPMAIITGLIIALVVPSVPVAISAWLAAVFTDIVEWYTTLPITVLHLF